MKEEYKKQIGMVVAYSGGDSIGLLLSNPAIYGGEYLETMQEALDEKMKDAKGKELGILQNIQDELNKVDIKNTLVNTIEELSAEVAKIKSDPEHAKEHAATVVDLVQAADARFTNNPEYKQNYQNSVQKASKSAQKIVDKPELSVKLWAALKNFIENLKQKVQSRRREIKQAMSAEQIFEEVAGNISHFSEKERELFTKMQEGPTKGNMTLEQIYADIMSNSDELSDREKDFLDHFKETSLKTEEKGEKRDSDAPKPDNNTEREMQ